MEALNSLVLLMFPLAGVSRLNLRDRRFVALARDNGETNATEGMVIFYDDILSGFGVRVSAGGTKSYRGTALHVARVSLQ